MENRALLLGVTRLRDIAIAYGHAMPIRFAYSTGIALVSVIDVFTEPVRGSSVPISWGGPPVSR